MFKNKKILSLIPARIGSRGIPYKNIKLLCGKPLIAWTIEQAKNSKYIDAIVVSTDDEEIAKASKEYGAEVPFMRPKELATDTAKIVSVILHTVQWMKKNNRLYDLLILLQPTSPLRATKDIDKAIEMLFSKKAKAIVSVCKSEHHPYWMNTLSKGGCMKDFIKPDVINKNRQEVPQFYRLNGAVYLGYLDYIKKHKGFFGNETYAYIMPNERSIDIDSEIDFKLSEIMKRSQ